MIVPAKVCRLKDRREIVLRSVAVAEARQMLDHLIITASESYRNLNRSADHWRGVSEEDEKKILQNFTSSPMGFMLGAFDQSKIVAALGMFHTDGAADRFNLKLGISIQNAFKGIGLGSALMKYSLEQAHAVGAHRIELSVRVYNQEGIALYEKFGFRKIGTLKEVAFIDGKFEDEYLYELLLAKPDSHSLER